MGQLDHRCWPGPQTRPPPTGAPRAEVHARLGGSARSSRTARQNHTACVPPAEVARIGVYIVLIFVNFHVRCVRTYPNRSDEYVRYGIANEHAPISSSYKRTLFVQISARLGTSARSARWWPVPVPAVPVLVMMRPDHSMLLSDRIYYLSLYAEDLLVYQV